MGFSTRRVAITAGLVAGALLVGSTAVAAPSGVNEPAGAQKAAQRMRNSHQTEEPPPPPEPQSVRYRVTLNIEWNRASHPVTVPPNEHVSPPVVATHQMIGDLFAPGQFASAGVEVMAEVGSTGTLVSELNAKRSVTSVTTGRRIDGAGSQSFDVTVEQGGSYISLVTMLAPSPDWFVGVREQMFVDGSWRDTVEVDLGNYDAGTDSGPGFTSPNADTNPAQVISGPRDTAFAAAVSEGRFGTVTIERLP